MLITKVIDKGNSRIAGVVMAQAISNIIVKKNYDLDILVFDKEYHDIVKKVLDDYNIKMKIRIPNNDILHLIKMNIRCSDKMSIYMFTNNMKLTKDVLSYCANNHGKFECVIYGIRRIWLNKKIIKREAR